MSGFGRGETEKTRVAVSTAFVGDTGSGIGL